MFFHNPVTLARRFATLDVLSGGRFLQVLDLDGQKDEYGASGIPFRQKGARADEFMKVQKRIWTDDVVEFRGQFYNIPASKIGPKPVQKPHLTYLGAYSPKAFPRIVNYADGWIPIAGSVPIGTAGTGYKRAKRSYKKGKQGPIKYSYLCPVLSKCAGLLFSKFFLQPTEITDEWHH